MKRDASGPEHNYMRKLEQMWATGALPQTAGYHEIAVDHDVWCGIFQARHCNCDPDISLKYSLTGNNN